MSDDYELGKLARRELLKASQVTAFEAAMLRLPQNSTEERRVQNVVYDKPKFADVNPRADGNAAVATNESDRELLP